MKTTLSQILRSARAGSPARAWTMFVDSGWDQVDDDPSALTLKGRLLKDQAKIATGEARLRLFSQAGDAYGAAADLSPATYPLINAATLALLAGDQKLSFGLAETVIEMLDNGTHGPETKYWLAATRAEALLLLGDEQGAQKALGDAILVAPQAWEDHAATLGQFTMLLQHMELNDDWLDDCRPPLSLHFSGIIHIDLVDTSAPSEIDEYLARTKPGFAFGALAAGADIMIAEAACAQGAELYVTLPYTVEHFRDVSVRPFGDHWVPRFDRLIEQAIVVETLPNANMPFLPAIELANEVAMGKAIRRATNLQSRAEALIVVGNGEAPSERSAPWGKAGHGLTSISARRSKPRDQTETDAMLLAILCVAGAESVDIGNLQKAAQGYQQQENGIWFFFDKISEAYNMGRELVDQNPHALKLSLDCDVIDISDADEFVLERSLRIASAAETDGFLAHGNAAMSLLLREPKISTEPLGDLHTAEGPLAIWSLK